jgi:hypothetical protein
MNCVKKTISIYEDLFKNDSARETGRAGHVLTRAKFVDILCPYIILHQLAPLW